MELPKGTKTAVACSLITILYVFGCGNWSDQGVRFQVLSVTLQYRWPIFVVFCFVYFWSVYEMWHTSIKRFRERLNTGFGENRNYLHSVPYLCNHAKDKLVSTAKETYENHVAERERMRPGTTNPSLEQKIANDKKLLDHALAIDPAQLKVKSISVGSKEVKFSLGNMPDGADRNRESMYKDMRTDFSIPQNSRLLFELLVVRLKLHDTEFAKYLLLCVVVALGLFTLAIGGALRIFDVVTCGKETCDTALIALAHAGGVISPWN